MTRAPNGEIGDNARMRIRLVSLAFVAFAGCVGQPTVDEPAAIDQIGDSPGVQYTVMAPYRAAGIAQAGSDTNTYTVLPTAPIAADPWQLLFCYQAYCVTVKQPLTFIPSGESNLQLQGNATLISSGTLPCSSWTPGSSISWYDGTPLHWHIALDATCTDGSVQIRGDWMRVN